MFGIGGTIKIVAMLAIVSIAVGGFYYITGLRADLAVSEQNNKKLSDAIETQQEVIEQQRQDFEQITAANKTLSSTIERQTQDLRNLQDRFSRSTATGRPRDFGATAAERPEAIQRTINRASAAAFRCLELASGDEPTAEELAAVTPDTINRECPGLANPNYTPGETK